MRTIPVPDAIAELLNRVVVAYCARIGDFSDDAKHLAHIAIIQRGCHSLQEEIDDAAPVPREKGKVA